MCLEIDLSLQNEPQNEKKGIVPMQNQRCGSAVFATWIVQSLFILNQEFQAWEPTSITIQTVLCQTWLETPKTSFIMSWLYYNRVVFKRKRMFWCFSSLFE